MIITIEGPTGAGKSSLAIELAKALDTQIISSDSRQVYRYLDIGTAKVKQAQQKEIKHHLIDIINPDQSYNAGLFAADASAIIAKLRQEDKIPIICGGTGLYIRSLLEGLFQHPAIDTAIREGLRLRLHVEGLSELYSELSKLDPSFAQRIGPKDPQRTLRGLEIFQATGKTISQHWAEQNNKNAYNAFRILIMPPREQLYEKINLRLREMVEQGLPEEILSVLERGYSWDDPGLNSLGYKEFRPHFDGDASIAECAILAAQHHRNYAKRQSTWYRKVSFDLTIPSSCFNLSDVLRAIHA